MVTFVFTGLYTLSGAYLADLTFYMNRDDSTWSYVDVAFFMFIAIVAIIFTKKSIAQGCKFCSCSRCCSSRSGCCRGCCAERELEEETDIQ